MSTHLEGLEKERDFYFNKVRVSERLVRFLPLTPSSQLRDIEILVTAYVEANEKQGNPDVLLNEMQKILYSTEVRLSAELFHVRSVMKSFIGRV